MKEENGGKLSVGISTDKGFAISLKSLGEKSFFLRLGSRGILIDEKSGNTGSCSVGTKISEDG